MGKAFSDEEKQEIREKLLETGEEMFHDNSVKAINIRELTSRAGISQGGFYTFYIERICGVMSGAFVLFVHSRMIDRAYFDEIFKAFIDADVRKYIKKLYS